VSPVVTNRPPRRSLTSSTTPWRRRGLAAVSTTCYREVPASCRPRSACFTQSLGSAACTRCSISASSPCFDTSVSTWSIGCRYPRDSRSTLSTAELPPPTPRDHRFTIVDETTAGRGLLRSTPGAWPSLLPSHARRAVISILSGSKTLDCVDLA